MRVTIDQLRSYAVARSLFEPTDLLAAINQLGFVQADPIRSPARAQDLILRHRVVGYHAGELEARYSHDQLIEDYVHVYGFLPRPALTFLQPRSMRTRWQLDQKSALLAKRLLRLVQERGSLHPRQAHEALGSGVRKNAWGTESLDTTQILEKLHFAGQLMVVRRQKGIRVYSLAPKNEGSLSSKERALSAALLLLRLYAPLPRKSFLQILRMARWGVDLAVDPGLLLDDLITRGWAQRAVINGVEFFWPGDESLGIKALEKVKFLAPFDPIVWDRFRFEMFWNWKYRFEAYTPVSRRTMGYYAMPLLWHDQVIGWVNIKAKGQSWDFKTGFASKRPRGDRFKIEFDAEVERFKQFMTSFQPS